jgi:hypothetical protein
MDQEASERDIVIGRLIDAPRERDLVVKEYGAIEGGRQTLARLAEHLAGAAQ